MHDHRHLRLLDSVGEQVGLGGRVEDDRDLEFGGDPQGRIDVGGTVHGHQKRQPAGEHLRKRLAAQVAVRFLLVVRPLLLPQVVERFHKFAPQHRHRLAAGARRFGFGIAAVRPGVVAERDRDHRGGPDHGLFDGVADGLHHHGLARHERPRRVAGVDRRDAEATEPLDEPLPRIVGVDRPQLWLDRLALVDLVLILLLVEIARQPDGGVGVDEPRRHDLAPQHGRTGRDRGLPGLRDLADLAIDDDHDAVFDGRPGHGVDGVAIHRDSGGFFLGDGVEPPDATCQRDRKQGDGKGEAVHRLVSESRMSVQQAWAF